MARRNDDVECETETWLIRNHIEPNESYFHIFVYLADNMKRENEDNYEEPQQQIMDNIIAQDQGTDNDESQDAINDTNNFNQNNQDNGGGPNPPKRQRRNDDEEIRLLIPSKVCSTLSPQKLQFNRILSFRFEKQQKPIIHNKKFVTSRWLELWLAKAAKTSRSCALRYVSLKSSMHILFFQILLSFVYVLMNKIPIPFDFL